MDNYKGHKGLYFENIAISSLKETKPFYSINIPQAKFASGLSSFNKEVLMNQIKRGYVDNQANEEGIEIANRKKLIVKEEIQCDTFNNVFRRNKVKKIDFLQIDAEGFDFEIIKMFPFDRFKPNVINYENENLSKDDKDACVRFLNEKGYITFDYFPSDTIAFLNTSFQVFGLETPKIREYQSRREKVRKTLGHGKYVLKKKIKSFFV